MTFGMVLLVTACAMAVARQAVDRDVENRFASQSDTVVASIQAGLADAEVRLLALQGLFRASEEVTPAEFTDFVDDLGTSSGVSGMAYMPIVPAADLAAFQRDMARWFAGYEVSELDEDGKRVPARDRSIYFPIQYFEPPDALDRPLGLDVGSSPEHLNYLLEAAHTGETVATPLLPLGTTGQDGFVMYRGIEDPAGHIYGLVAVRIALDDLMADRVPANLSTVLDWTIRDVTAEATQSATTARLDPHLPVLTPVGAGMVHTEIVKMIDRVWQIDISPTDDSRLPGARNEPYWILLIGLVVAIFAAVAVSSYSRSREATLEMQSMQHTLDAKNEFLATVSHELRTPLTSVLGFAELLRDDDDAIPPGERSELIATIAEQASDIAGIIDDLIVMERDEHGTLTLAAVAVNVRAQTAQVLESLDLTERVQVECADSGMIALADPAAVRQIIRNLIANAAAYGGPNIRVTVAPRREQLAIDVIDDGPGVPPEHAGRIFDPYYRSSSATGTPGPLGLGLAVSRKLAHRMGGELTHHRTHDSTFFTLTLPTRQDQSESDPADADDQGHVARQAVAPRW